MQHLKSLKSQEGKENETFHSYFKSSLQVLLQSMSTTAGDPFYSSQYEDL